MGRYELRVPGPRGRVLLYGANGYTGGLILQRCLECGLHPILAGRHAAAISSLAGERGLDHRILGLADARTLRKALDDVQVVIHAAGPFAQTAMPMARACIEAGTHYLDITGEIGVFEALHGLDASARAAGVVLLPGAGFDVVPTDLLAAHLKRRLPAATHLQLAFRTMRGGVSRGTARTALAGLGEGGAVRRNGRITRVPPAWRSRVVDFGFGVGPTRVVTIPWGDVSTAWYSTGIPNIEVYTAMGAGAAGVLKATRVLGRVGLAPLRVLLGSALRFAPAGPDAVSRSRAAALVWGAARDDDGVRVETRMRTPEGYTFTAAAAVEAALRLARGGVPPGFHTPSTAWGADWILGLEGVEREDVA